MSAAEVEGRYKFAGELTGSLWRSIVLLAIAIFLVIYAPLAFKLFGVAFAVSLGCLLVCELGFVKTRADALVLRGSIWGSIPYPEIESLDEDADPLSGVWKYITSDQARAILAARQNPLIRLRLRQPKWFMYIAPAPFPRRTRYVTVFLESVEAQERLKSDLEVRCARAGSTD